MERRIALVAALSLTVLVGSILLVSAAGLPSGGEQDTRQGVAATPVADLTATGTADTSLDGRDDDLADDGYDDDGNWSGESGDDEREHGGSADNDDRYEDDDGGEWSDDD